MKYFLSYEGNEHFFSGLYLAVGSTHKHFVKLFPPDCNTRVLSTMRAPHKFLKLCETMERLL
jgi:hypothetical protein